jgi:hypothetical protein
MKKIVTISIFIISAIASAQLFGCGKKQGLVSDTMISNKEKESLLFMREEEKLAYDIYTAMYAKWDLTPFSNISSSEASHMAAVKTLIDRYQLKDPVQPGSGVFTNQTLQQLYNQLLQQGNTSLTESLMAGAAIEEIDIRDLKEQLNFIQQADIRTVYDNLMRGSRNHLRAFVRNLDMRGITYKPQYLSQKEYDDIINSPMEQGGMNKKNNSGCCSNQ